MKTKEIEMFILKGSLDNIINANKDELIHICVTRLKDKDYCCKINISIDETERTATITESEFEKLSEEVICQNEVHDYFAGLKEKLFGGKNEKT